MIKVVKNAIPHKPVETAKAALRPCMYAIRIPGSSSGVNAVRSADAPVAISFAESTPGADVRSLASIWLTKAAWAEEMVKAPPTVWKTAHLSLAFPL
jgi:hypothetical protein